MRMRSGCAVSPTKKRAPDVSVMTPRFNLWSAGLIMMLLPQILDQHNQEEAWVQDAGIYYSRMTVFNAFIMLRD
jgi:hypothetical protein